MVGVDASFKTRSRSFHDGLKETSSIARQLLLWAGAESLWTSRCGLIKMGSVPVVLQPSGEETGSLRVKTRNSRKKCSYTEHSGHGDQLYGVY